MLQSTIQTHPTFRIDVAVNDPQDLNRLLDQAVQRTIPTALERGQGILVTQIFPNKYSVAVDAEVPCGVTYERRLRP